MSEEKKEVEGDVRLRDLVGRLSSELTKMREEVATLRKQQEDLFAFAEEGLDDLEASAPKSQLQTQAQVQAGPGDRVVRDINTGEYFVIPGTAMKQTDTQAKAQPKPGPETAPRSEIDPELLRFWRCQYEDLEDDLGYYGRVHPREASETAAAIVKTAIKSGRKVDDVLLEKATSDPAVKTVLLQRLERAGKALGLVLSPPAAPKEEPPKEQKPSKSGTGGEPPGTGEASGLPNLPPKETVSEEQEVKRLEKALLDRADSLLP